MSPSNCSVTMDRLNNSYYLLTSIVHQDGKGSVSWWLNSYKVNININMCVVIMKAGVTQPHMKYASSGYTPHTIFMVGVSQSQVSLHVFWVLNYTKISVMRFCIIRIVSLTIFLFRFLIIISLYKCNIFLLWTFKCAYIYIQCSNRFTWNHIICLYKMPFLKFEIELHTAVLAIFWINHYTNRSFISNMFLANDKLKIQKKQTDII